MGLSRRRLHPQQGQRRHQTGDRHPLALDQGEAGVRRRRRRHHHRRPDIEGAQITRRAHREVMRRRQGRQIDAGRAQFRDHRAFAHAVQIVVVRARDQLGKAGRAARNLQEGHIGRIGVLGRQRRRIGAEGVERSELLRLAHHDHMAQFGNLGLNGAGQDPVVEALMSVGHDIGRGLGPAQEVNDLGRAVRGQRIDGDQLGPEQTEDHAEELGQVRQLHHDPVARLQPQRQEPGSGRLGLFQQFAIGPALVHADHGDGVGGRLDAIAQQLGEGFAAPIALGAIKGRQIVRPDLLQGNHTLASSTPRARRTAWNLPDVSSASAAGSEPSTTPAPA